MGTVRIENVGGVRTITLARVEKWPAPRNATNQRLNPPQIRFGQLKWSRRCPCGISAVIHPCRGTGFLIISALSDLLKKPATSADASRTRREHAIL